MGRINQLYTMGWYGECGGQPCTGYDLANDTSNVIEGVWRMDTSLGHAENGYESYLSSLHGQGINAFEHLSCGSSYIIKLREDAVVAGMELNIPGFMVSTSDVDNGRITDDCNSSVPCCAGFDYYYATDGLGGEHTASGGMSAEYFDQGGKICFHHLDMTPTGSPVVGVSGVWKNEVKDVPFGVIVLTGEPRHQATEFRYVSPQGICWVGELNSVGADIVISER